MIARTQEEVDVLREGGKRLARHLRALSKLVAPGVSARELEERAHEMIVSEGDEPAFLGYPSGKRGEQFPGALCVSINDAVVHGPAMTNEDVIQDGDIVSLDLGVKHKGLYTDHAVTLIAGTPRSKEEERLVRDTNEALALGIAQAKVGNTTGDIGYAVERFAKRIGYGYPKVLSGHGVGRAVHEEPHVPNFGAPGSGEKLVEGLVIAVEPMFSLGSGDVYLDKDGFTYRTKDRSRAAHAEHTIIVTRSGPEILTAV